MIIWCASYPKSGNTWLRAIISSLLYTQDGIFNFNLLDKVAQFPSRRQFKDFTNDYLDYLDLKKICPYWISAQEKINSDGKLRIFKTHNGNYNIGGNDFTNKKNTLAAIYIVRDPRNIITSIMHHFSKESYQDAKEFIFDENRWLGAVKTINNKSNDTHFPTLISSWKTHYNSWKIVKKNFLLIKYEELILNPDNEFKKIIEYLKNLVEVNIDNQKFKRAIEACSFKNLKSIENKSGFVESVLDSESDSKKNFFNLGPDNDWKKLLNKNIRLEIEEKFKDEMVELGYL